MNRKPYIIAKEGWRRISIRAGLFLFFMIIGCELFAMIALFCAFYIAFSYYDPEILLNKDENEIVSSSSGTVSSIQIQDANILVEIDSGLFDNSLVRAPISGTIENFNCINGIKLSTANILSNKLNSQISFDIVNDKRRVSIQIIEDSMSFDLDAFVKDGDIVNVADRLAVCTNYKLRLLLPKDILLNIDLNSDVKQGQSVIGFCK
jgi:hypothetical protein